MASCRQIKDLFTAYLDDELGSADRLIFEQHLKGCPNCQAELESFRGVAAMLFENHVPDRLRKDLTEQIMAHLPEIEETFSPAHELTARTKQAGTRSPLFKSLAWVPLLAPVFVLLLGVMMWTAWPKTEPVGARQVGMVLMQQGPSVCTTETDSARHGVHIQDTVKAAVRYETAQDATLMLGLDKSTVVKVFGGTRVKICNERELRLESGSLYLEVGHAERYFRVNTPDGLVTVFGTEFGLEIRPEGTQVTVVRGEVQVENDKTFTVLTNGEQTKVEPRSTVLATERVSIDGLLAKAEALRADPGTERIYRAKVSKDTPKVLHAEQVFVVETGEHAINAIRLEWKANPYATGHTGYDVYVSDNNMRPLFKTRVDASVFGDKTKGTHTIHVPGSAVLSATKVLHISLLPDYSTGSVETSFTEVAVIAP